MRLLRVFYLKRNTSMLLPLPVLFVPADEIERVAKANR
jgi:hypothetical protein